MLGARTAALATLALAACGDNLTPPLKWGMGVQRFDAVALGLTAPTAADPFAQAITPTTRLTVPTYDLSDQVVHPDVLRDGDHLIFAVTPYPFGRNRFENPSVLRSPDGLTFDEVRPAGNPVVPPPPIDHNDDPDLHRDPVTGEYVLLYLETLRPKAQNLIALRSRDLVTWSSEIALPYDLTAGDPFIVSPATILSADATHLFYVNTAEPYHIETMASPDGRTWDKTQRQPVALDLGAITPWHLDVFACATGYGMLISGYPDKFTHQNLYLATSPDLVTWTLRPEPLLAHDDPSLAVESLYRSTGLVLGDQLVVWYSMQYRD
jgi:hypothetical protein